MTCGRIRQFYTRFNDDHQHDDILRLVGSLRVDPVALLKWCGELGGGGVRIVQRRKKLERQVGFLVCGTANMNGNRSTSVFTLEQKQHSTAASFEAVDVMFNTMFVGVQNFPSINIVVFGIPKEGVQ